MGGAGGGGAEGAGGVGGRLGGRVPVRRLTVLYDPACRLCSFASGWLARQRQLVPLDLVPVGSPEALRRFPALDHRASTSEVTVVGDAGQVYRGDSAWIVCLWALADYRAYSHTLTSPAGRRLARAAVLSAAKYRESQAREPARGEGMSIKPTRGEGKHAVPARAGGQPADATRRGRGVPPAGGATPVWVYLGSGGWTYGNQEPLPERPREAGQPAPSMPPGWTYDEVAGWTQGDQPTGTPGGCADGCSPSG
ncbi:thiol-disulfide oxidoreductase DCC family protein [Streptomyces sp. NBC_01190]|uniref:thiol-disulfide oxidoreductase DCC family protein n=1 Tax=Streptomyces sp. NBC_01190 TaxID=2903767 RepID=UPI00386B06D5